MSGLPSDQIMAIMRLKQWAFDRAALRHGRTARIEFSGWKERRQCEADSRNVRVIDFELALSKLDPMHQQILLLTYRDGIRHAQAAHMIGCSRRAIAYLLPAARRRLADILDRLDLL